MNTHTETLTWHCLPGKMPDADITVLISSANSGEVWPGWLDGEIWHWGDGKPLRVAVKAWADMPAGLVGVSP